MTIERLTAAELIVEYLIHEEVPYVLGIFGHGNVQLGEALYERRDRITFIPVKNEQNAVHMATAYAKVTGRPLAVTTSIGPGATNLVTGAACAHVNRLPVLLLPGDSFADESGKPVLQQIEGNPDTDCRANDTLKPVSVYWKRITRPEQLMRALLEAFDRMLEPGSEGPAVLCLPMDVQAEAHEFDLDNLFTPRDLGWQRFIPDPRAIGQAAFMIETASRPVIIAGGGVLRSRAWNELMELAELAQIPVVHTHAGNGAMLYDHPLNVFNAGPSGSDCGNAIVQSADLVIGVGTRYTDFTTASDTLFAPGARFININVSHTDIGKRRALKLYGDAKASLRSLNRLLGRMGKFDRKSYLRCVTNVRRNWIRRTEKWAVKGLTQPGIVGAVNDAAGRSGIVVAAAGSLPTDLLRFWKCRDPERLGYHLEYGYSTMGYEIAGGIGAKLARPGRNIFVMVGDGSFLMASQDLVTAVERKIPITVVLIDNGGHRSIEGCQTNNGMTGFGTLGNTGVDFAKIAEGYGCKTLVVSDRDGLVLALSEAKKELTRPTVIVVRSEHKKTFKVKNQVFWDVPPPDTENHKTVRMNYIEKKKKQVIK